ncbi:hypothetical protein AYI69_g10013 [Smittium culicis]|uniref:Uncharacterized protein n=1 Tax=Smittium culicis TaxID=133412 RepID=A0A1R1X8U1_9FUNG|nr:hypothetical protein AYI69_g10013 [Smittium culicis]
MIQKVLDHGYGRVGKLKFEILADQTDYSDAIYELDIKLLRQPTSSSSHTRICQIDSAQYLASLKLNFPVIYELMNAQFGKSSIVAKLPTHRHVLARNARNIQTIHMRKLIAKLYVPLPLRTIIDIQTRAAAGPPTTTSTATISKNRSSATVACTYNHLDYASDLAQNFSDLATNNTDSINERLNFQYISRSPPPPPTSSSPPSPPVANAKLLTKIPHLRLFKKSYMNLLDKCPYIYFIPAERSTGSSTSSGRNSSSDFDRASPAPASPKPSDHGPANIPVRTSTQPGEHAPAADAGDNQPPPLTIKRALELAACSPTSTAFVIRKSLWSTSPIPTLTMVIDSSSTFL